MKSSEDAEVMGAPDPRRQAQRAARGAATVRVRAALMECVFAVCGWAGEPVAVRTDPQDVNATQLSIPMHPIAGPAEWFAAVCPASMAELPLKPSDIEFVEQSRRSYIGAKLRRARGETHAGPVWSAPPNVRHGDPRAATDKHPPESCPYCSARGLEVLFDDRAHLIDHIAEVHDFDVRADSSEPPGGHIDVYFPIRPSEEAEAEDELRQQQGQTPKKRGFASMAAGENDRSGLKGMLALIAAESGLAQEKASMITEHLEAALGTVEMMAAHQQSAGALAIGAVGSDSDLPESAQNMVHAASRLGEIINDIRTAVQNAHGLTDSAARTSARVATEANAYSASF